mmetsp:Transcript_12141/g.28342  ORF Transcript_12141/g.28342 Transcript_12141/m.28342 type:complete len:233 (+) Transcript_12141:154-852(+)
MTRFLSPDQDLVLRKLASIRPVLRPRSSMDVDGTVCPATARDRSSLSPGNFAKRRSSKRVNSCVMNILISTMFLTVATLEPLSCRMHSMKSGKLISSISLNKNSPNSANPITSTPTSCKALIALGFSKRASNSSLEIMWSPSTSVLASMSCMCNFKNVASICSLSTSDTLLTTSTRTPTSMFMSIKVASKMKSSMSTPLMASSRAMSLTRSAKSGRVPRSSSVFHDSKNVGK